MPPSREQRRSNVRRANVTACTRCRSRKQRCDQNLPACSNCERAGVECVSTDIDGRIAPRSYMKSLEDRIAYLETQLAAHGIEDIDMLPADLQPVDLQPVDLQSTDMQAIDFSPAETSDIMAASAISPGTDVDSEDLVGRIALNCLDPHAFSQGIVNQNGLSLLRSLLSAPMTKVSWTEKKSDNQSLLDELPREISASMPRHEVAGRLIDTYFEHCNFFSPIVSSKKKFLVMIKPLYGDTSTADLPLINVRFRALVVFGTSILLLNRTDPSVPISRSEGYFAAATQLFSQHPDSICTGDLEHLANLLLVIQYACFSSNLTAAWHFLGLATRLVVELNLHNERTRSSLDPHQLNERRWLFWSTYTFERNLCAILGRPFSIPDEAIETALPMPPSDEPERALAVHLIKSRQLESEIYTTLNQREPINGAILNKEQWKESIQRRLLQWHATVPPIQHTSQLAPTEIFNGSLYNALVHIYYPSYHFPNPSSEDLALLAQSATNAINCYRQSFRAGELRFYWRTVHNVFRAGVAMAYCAQMAAMQQNPELNLSDATASINSCSSILWGMVERYPAGQAYRDIFDSIAHSVANRQREQAEMGDSRNLFAQNSHQSQTSIFADISTDLGSNDLPLTALDVLSWGFGDLSEVHDRV
ncbi:fungal-specific transcription factor domain-containing protein [Dactylonectria estremocensis]|uniref:Fungal-specific transcription factor domain-containing protein n=1 Tax=Dactylonectria estremocensis TaxID=1079267 RepID=A0A9P9EMK0_9HYPO|nr:fungal-specific transcription factor domain-containing protein [Dactylonectria estremocensis]